MALDAATLALLAKELREKMLSARIDKIFQPTRDEVLIAMRSRTENFKLFVSARSGSARIGIPMRNSKIRRRRLPFVCCYANILPADGWMMYAL